MTGQDPLIRLAEELGTLGQRLAEVGAELRNVGAAARTSPAEQDATPTGESATPPDAVDLEGPAGEDSTLDGPGHDVRARNTPDHDAPTQDTSAQGDPTQGIPVQDIPVQDIPAQDIPAQGRPPVVGSPVPPQVHVPPQGTPVPHGQVAAQAVPGQGPPPPHAWPYTAWGPHQPVHTMPVPHPVARPSLFERLGQDGVGSRILAWVGGAVTLLGVVLLLVLAVQRDYLGPLPRVIAGAVLGLVLTGIGLRLHRSETTRTGAFALVATGVAVLYLDVVAATSIYDFLDTGGGLVAGLVVTALGLLLAMKWDSVTLAVYVVASCAVCAPILTSGFTVELVAFLLVLKIAAGPVHLRRNWPWLAVTAGVPPLLASVLALGGRPDDPLVLAGTGLVAFVVTLAGAVLTDRVRPGDNTALGLALGAPAPALLTTVLLERNEGAFVAGLVSVITLGVWVFGRRSAFRAGVGGVGVFALFLATALALDGSVLPAVVLGEALVLTVLTWRTNSRGPLIGATVFGAAGGLLATSDSIPPLLLLQEPLWTRTPGDLVAGIVTAFALGTLAVVLPWAATRLDVIERDQVVWSLMGLIVLYSAASAVLCAALLVSQDATGFLFGHTIVTVSWTIAALVLLVKGIDRRGLRVAGLVLVGAAVAKLVLFDMAALDGFARVLAFMGAGLVLLAAGTRYAKLVATRRIGANSPEGGAEATRGAST
ncbi:DUF2339 domain-containing protein [Saccharothrix violaceirubra]|uniref:Putative membrane protein n=1 Tax=Saccharothrix violaceirubra TaxID=413306 RepID=A0A7W7TA46_9PSEU|nr:DUF2339 domain-containing protein [Saccharothrix violaceirubra]MBB4969325.1 putative membrane protein [Saccharothrix violaceirubra]